MKYVNLIYRWRFPIILGMFFVVVVLSFDSILQLKKQKVETKKMTQEINGLKNKIETQIHIIRVFETRRQKMIEWVGNNNSFRNPLHPAEIEAVVDMTLQNFGGDLLLAIARVESSFNKKAKSHANCLGLMQINPIHCRDFGVEEKDLFTPAINIWIASQLLKRWGITPENPDYLFLAEKYLGKRSKTYAQKIETAHDSLRLAIGK